MSWQIGLLLIAVAIVGGGLYFKFNSPENYFDKFFNLIVGAGFGICFLTGVVFIYDDVTSDIGDGDRGDYVPRYQYDQEDYSTGGNVNFTGSFNSKYKGNRCLHKDPGDAETCSDRGKCHGGFISKNRDPSICDHCDHSYADHPY